MADKSAIEWTDATWNPIVGCSVLTPGCTNCYAMKMAARIQKMNRTGGSGSNYVNHYDGTTQQSKAGAVWTGRVAIAPDKLFLKPMSWKQPRRIFCNSMGDLFHESIPDEWIDRAFAVMALCERHTFQVLTKRADRMKSYVNRWFMRLAESDQIFPHPAGPTKINAMFDWACMPSVLPNVWLGVSTERQKEADERIPLLLQTPAAVRFISAEPLLGHIDLHALNIATGQPWDALRGVRMVLGSDGENECTEKLDWVIVGGESGHNARPMHPQWVHSLRDHCNLADVAFFFKQWGAFVPSISGLALAPDGSSPGPDNWNAASTAWMDRVGKRTSGRLIAGREYSQFPAAAKAQAA